MLDDNDTSVVAMTAPAFVPAVVAMFAEFGARAEVMMIAAAPDHDVLSTGNRRCRDGDRAKGCNNISKLLHVVLLG